MKLVIHCGLHKTATTSFQTLCAENRALLRGLGVHYPEYDHTNQHSCVMWAAQREGLHALAAFFARIHAEAEPDCHTVLLSGEDFENCIVDVALAAEVEALAVEAGFDVPTWVVVTREAGAYVASVYSELSKHGVVLRRDVLERAAKDRGCFYLSSPKYSHIFVFDFPRFAERFKRSVSGEILEYEFAHFAEEYPGMVLFQYMLSDDAFARFRGSVQFGDLQSNSRLDDMQVEANYVSTALGMERLRRKRFRPLVAPLIWLRLWRGRGSGDAGSDPT